MALRCKLPGAVEGGTRVVHFIDINPKSLSGRLFAPQQP
jgi:hypothetical protein